METTFGRTVETRRLKSNRQNRSNCSLANIEKSDKLNDFLTDIILQNNNNNNNRMYDSNAINQFDSQLERINNELARAQFMNNLNTNIKKANSGYLSDSECYATKLPTRLKIKTETYDKQNKMNYSYENDKLLRNNLNRYNNIINNMNAKQQQNRLRQEQNANLLKQKRNEFFYNLIKTNQYKNNEQNRSYRLGNNTKDWQIKQINFSDYMQGPAAAATNVRSKLIKHRCSNETLSIFDQKETVINDCNSEFKTDFDKSNYLTWKNFNHNPSNIIPTTTTTTTINNTNTTVAPAQPKLRYNYEEKKYKLDDEINQLKLKFRNQYVCDDYSSHKVDEMQEIENFKLNSPLNHYSLTLPKHSRLNERKNNNKIIEKPIKLDLSNSYNTADQSKIEVVPLENALLNMNEILKNLTLNSNKKSNDFDRVKSSFDNKETTDYLNNEKPIKDLSPPLSTSTSISLSPPPPTYLNEQISPSSSLSSSSYTNSTKSSSSNTNSENKSSESSKSSERSFSLSTENNNKINNDNVKHESFSTQFMIPQEVVNKKLNKNNDKTEQISFGKKLKRFLSISGTYKRQTENEKFDTLKKKIYS